MKKVITTQRIPIKMWLEDMEPEALQQAKNLADLPFAFRHIAIMPDAHVGYGMPIGGVMAARNVVVPNAVGVDIGCGMCATRTSITNLDIEQLKRILSQAREIIPVGFNWHHEKQEESFMPKVNEGMHVVKRQYQAALKQIGTLGGGNHFIEIQKGSDGFIWLMVHSGSRNIGLNVAGHYHKKAIILNERFFSQITTDKQLAFLPIETEEAHQYLNEMKYCTEFALASRQLMLKRFFEAFKLVAGPCEHSDIINKAHNYAAWENHFGENVLVHRKGATRARAGETGIIPGSQGSYSYIVKGLGNPESFNSCSHGAGRKMGRREARRSLNLKEEIKKLNRKRIVHAVRNEKDLDEAPGSYKDINEVMENQKDLAEIVVELTPLAVMKG